MSNTAQATIKPKLSVKDLCGKVRAPEARKHLCDIFGTATKAVHGETNFGEFVAFAGDFMGVVGDKKIRAGKCFLPGVASNLVEGALGNSTNVEFAFRIFVAPSNNQIGYEYEVESMIEPSKAEPLLALESKIYRKEPEADEKPETKAEPETEHKGKGKGK